MCELLDAAGRARSPRDRRPARRPRINIRSDGGQPHRLGHGYLISDYPLTRAAIEERRPQTVSQDDPEPDENETETAEGAGLRRAPDGGDRRRGRGVGARRGRTARRVVASGTEVELAQDARGRGGGSARSSSSGRPPSTVVRVTICDVGRATASRTSPETLAPASSRRARQSGSRRRSDSRASRPRASSAQTRCRRWRAPKRSSRGDRAASWNRVLGPGAEREGLTSALAARRSRPRQLHASRRQTASAGGTRTNRVDEARPRRHASIERAELPVTVTISVAFGCPFEGRVDPGVVADLAARFPSAEVVLADTIGVATPRQVRGRSSSARTLRRAPAQHAQHRLRECGRRTLEAVARRCSDASCAAAAAAVPIAPRATGNIATEDLGLPACECGDRGRHGVEPRRA